MDQNHRSRASLVRCPLLIATLLAIASLYTTPIHVDDTHLVIAVGENPTGFEKRIKAELLSLGFEVTMATTEPEMVPHETLDTLAAEVQASAAIRIESLPDRVEIWVADRITGKLLRREIKVSGDSAESHAVVSFAAIDLLRASLMELDAFRKEEAIREQATQEQQSEPIREEVVQKEVKLHKKEERLSLGIAPSLVMGALGPSPGFDVLLDIHIKANRYLGFGLLGYIPVASSKFESAVGDGEASIGFVGVDARLTGRIKKGRWRLNLAPGFGVLLVKLTGQATNDSYEGHKEFAVTAAPILHGGISFLVVDPLSIRLDALGGFSLTAIEVQMGQEIEATFGRPILAFNLGIDLRVW